MKNEIEQKKVNLYFKSEKLLFNKSYTKIKYF